MPTPLVSTNLHLKIDNPVKPTETQRGSKRTYTNLIDLEKSDCEACQDLAKARRENPSHLAHLIRDYRCPHREREAVSDDVRRLSIKEAYRVAATFLCTPKGLLPDPRHNFYFTRDSAFNWEEELSHISLHADHGVSQFSSFDDHEPYEFSDEELEILESTKSRLPASKETINQTNPKRMRSIGRASRVLLRDQYLPLAHRVKGMLTIKAIRKRHTFTVSKVVTNTVSKVVANTVSKVVANTVIDVERSRPIPTKEQTKSYLDSKLKDLYITLSELNTGKPFRLVPNADSAQFIAFFHDVRSSRTSGKIIPTSPHYHVLILDDASAFTKPKTLAPLLQRLSGKADREFEKPEIHLDFPDGGLKHYKHLDEMVVSPHEIGVSTDHVVPLRTQRIKMIRYGTKYMWRDAQEDDGWKVVKSEKFNKRYSGSEEQAFKDLKLSRRKKNREKKKNKLIKRTLNEQTVRAPSPAASSNQKLPPIPPKNQKFDVEVIRRTKS